MASVRTASIRRGSHERSVRQLFEELARQDYFPYAIRIGGMLDRPYFDDGSDGSEPPLLVSELLLSILIHHPSPPPHNPSELDTALTSGSKNSIRCYDMTDHYKALYDR